MGGARLSKYFETLNKNIKKESEFGSQDQIFFIFRAHLTASEEKIRRFERLTA